MTVGRRRNRKTYPDTMADVRARLFAHLRQQIGPVSDEHLSELLRASSAWSPQGARVLDEHLKLHPDAFRAPDPHCPRVLVRLAASLQSAGYPVVRPRCARCGVENVELPRLAEEGRCCEWCLTRERLTLCPRCGLEGFPTAKRPEGTICRRCYNDEMVEECVKCGKLRSPSTRDETGGALCWSCNPRPIHPCSRCGQLAQAKTGKRGIYLCATCYREHEHPKRPCGICGVESIIIVRGRGGSEDRCRRCRVEPRHECWHCAQLRPAKAIWPVGPVCSRCHRRAIECPGTCENCGQTKVLIGRTLDGTRICGPCAGVKTDYVCQCCGRAGAQFYSGLCEYCSARRRAVELLWAADGVPRELAPLVEVIATERDPRAAIRWMARPRVAALLRHLAALGKPITHAELDQLPPTNTLHNLRHLLVYAGIIPPRIEPLERIEPWLASLLERLPAHQSKVIGPYAQWSVLRQARRRAVRRHYTTNSAGRDKAKVTAAICLLEWLDTRSLNLSQFTQADLELWLAENESRRSAIAGFIAWLDRQRIVIGLEIHHRVSGEPVDFPDPDTQVELIEALLASTCGLELRVRVAALVVLLYGQPVSAVCRLTTADVCSRKGKEFLTFAKHPVLIPPTLAVLVNQLAEDARHYHRAPGPAPLFPSTQRIGAPISAGAMNVLLNRNGIPARAGRNGALFTLAQDLPAAVLAQLLGLHISTAARWSRIAQRDWSHYLHARAENERDPE